MSEGFERLGVQQMMIEHKAAAKACRQESGGYITRLD